ncbi:O-antigen ligase [uncultured Prochlorococcus sp.]|uniref:O-antigen ligase family protein n=1 Tax=uncultured Prochlorococcus sp. TaxID=159733 RepID=UPI00258A31C0|nr:O-antigen ligase family protein [uncultured Prochlorococcus sp.]
MRFKEFLDNFFLDFEFNLFLLGILFLPSAPSIACIFFIFPLIKGFLKIKNKILKDKFNLTLLIASAIMILKTIFGYFQEPTIESWDPMLNLVGLANWIPLFICFWGFQPYLISSEKRLLISKFFIASSIPVLFSGINQYFFKIFGPFKIFNGLIIWYQRPIDFIGGGGLTGVFNNQNYTGAWLTMIFPICLGVFLINKKKNLNLKAFILLVISMFFVICSVLTNSRGAWISILVSIPIVMGRLTLYWLLPLVVFLVSIIILTLIPNIPEQLQNYLQIIIPKKVSIKFEEILLNFRNYPRIHIWINAIFYIVNKPLFGWGAAAFPILYLESFGLRNNHAHNLFLELSINYGLISSILIFGAILKILKSSYDFIFKEKTLLLINDRTWWAASIIFLLSHMYDVLYYDLRISISSWIFLSGLKVIIDKNSKINNIHKNA